MQTNSSEKTKINKLSLTECISKNCCKKIIYIHDKIFKLKYPIISLNKYSWWQIQEGCLLIFADPIRTPPLLVKISMKIYENMFDERDLVFD